MNPTSRKYFIYFIKILAIALLYHLTARLGLSMAYLQANTSPVWPPTGVAIAVLLISGLSFWPGISLGVFAGSVITGAPVLLALGMTIGNTMEAYLAAWFLKKRLNFHNEMDRVSDVIGLAIVSLFSTAVSATIGTISLVLFTQTPRSEFLNIWATWWIGDLLGALVVAPVILVWLKPLPFKAKQKNLAEGIGMVVMIALITWYVFGNTPPIDIVHQAMIYVLFPFIIWAALRFGQHGATISIFLISAIAIGGTVNGLGPFGQDSINERLILLQTFMGVVALTSLILAATTIERRKAALALQQRIEDLDTLNNASKSFLCTFDKADIYRTICMIAVEKFNAGCAWIDMPDLENDPYLPAAALGISMNEIQKLKMFLKNKMDFKGMNAAVVLPRDSFLQNKSYGAFPLIFGNSTLGVLNMLMGEDAAFSADKILLIQSYANLAAVAIQNAWLFDEVSRGNEQLHALSQRLMKAQEDERLHLSRELHDESGQILAALMVELGLINREPDGKEKIENHLNKINDLSLNLQTNLHRLAANLRPASLDHLGLVKALEQYVIDFSKQHSISVDFEAVGLERRRLPADIETSLFRVVQESLTNVALHADASHVDVLITYRNHHVIAVVEDNGVGFTTTSPSIEKQLGLFGMKERIEMLKGKFTLESAPRKGTTINVEVPVGN